MITLYDLEFTLPGKTVSPFVMKTRLALNYKKLPHRTVWIKDHELQARAAELGLPINDISDGAPRYKVPIIHDSSTGVSVSDSARIIAYLDKTYPDTPTLIPAGTEAAAVALDAAVLTNIIGSVFPAIAPRIGSLMDEKSLGVFRARVVGIIGMKYEEFFERPEFERGIWEKAAVGFSVADRIFEKARLVKGDASADEGPFLTGKDITYADISVGGALIWARRVLGDHEEPWEVLKGWNGGRWLKLYEALQPYAVIHA
ncbi:hypothetical protein FA13DRAFT_1754142 [Coprinellus micaceus]|uniref:GST N-terminal domain-containing protein n=1 Tax=Coprinellus micaceus TaxID=71717 RepID=A0A4Y7THJ9_COPMI|nr:hypothetical protein FA13DRAFT_1754142 [Coprinellus micaceus]